MGGLKWEGDGSVFSQIRLNSTQLDCRAVEPALKSLHLLLLIYGTPCDNSENEPSNICTRAQGTNHKLSLRLSCTNRSILSWVINGI